MSEVKKVAVATLDTRKFVEALLYLGSIGGKITNKCVAMKGLMLRAEVEVDADTPVNTDSVIRLSAGVPYVKESSAVEEKKEDKPAVKRGRKPAEKKEDSPSTSE